VLIAPPAAGRVSRPAVFLDRDGVLNQDIGYAHRPDQIVWVAGVGAAIRRLNDAGFLIFVVTNQAGVARGYYDEAAVLRLHRWMAEALEAAAGARIDAFYYCPHYPEGTREGYGMRCSCRKPAPGMLLRAMADWPVDAARSFLIGDKQSDIQAAEAAGVRGHLFHGGSLLDRVETILADTG
jgi:D-glycero-D-manno-heptose 1,7-bisphosphate phosphatase